MEKTKSGWIPKTELGRKVMNGEITSVNQIFEQGYIIREPEIVDVLVPNLENYLIHTGGMPGKGGGKMRTPVRITTRMHKSGRRRTLHALIILGNKDGLLGLGYATGEDAQRAIQKAERHAKLAIIPVRRGCGSWECGCGGAHSLPFKVHGRMGSVNVELLPAPRGLGLCVPHEIKKVLQLAGINDVWMRSYGNTNSRLNFVLAVFKALSGINKMRMPEKAEKAEEAKAEAALAAKAKEEAPKEQKAEVKSLRSNGAPNQTAIREAPLSKSAISSQDSEKAKKEEPAKEEKKEAKEKMKSHGSEKVKEEKKEEDKEKPKKKPKPKAKAEKSEKAEDAGVEIESKE